MSEALTIAEKDYKEFCGLFEGKPYEKIDEIVQEHGLTYGVLNWNDNMDIVDINYKHILATIWRDKGITIVSEIYEIYEYNH